ncbi:MAG: D-glycero-beta-D-manno-heptose-1,7-bisphosphate 7-phosphatase [Deltaproteobacteria bacterium]|nr:MAG: D-glycero-beta-D-manno-heptose-1,7-bisphosphate 7-phosphatase [Deltaproteobacteria bacterium]
MPETAKQVPAAVFIDRDGVINLDSPNYIKTPDECSFISGSLEAIVRLSRAGIPVILITNQSVIGRGMVTLGGLFDIFRKLLTSVETAGGRITDIFFCPHHPDDGCACRKPLPGLLYQARDKYGIDLSRTIMIGDSVKDLAAARNAGCGNAWLVLTGNGKPAMTRLIAANQAPDAHFPDLAHAADHLLSALMPSSRQGVSL